jgi:hypothetical protein
MIRAILRWLERIIDQIYGEARFRHRIGEMDDDEFKQLQKDRDDMKRKLDQIDDMDARR